MRTRTLRMVRMAVVLAGLFALVVPSAPASSRIIETFTGTVISVGGASGGRSANITVRVYRYATEEDARLLASSFADGGSRGLLRTLQRIKPMGSVAVGPRVSYDVGAVFSMPSEHGRRIVIVTERPIQQYELRNATRSSDYPFGVLEMDLDAKGEGSGSLIPRAKIYMDKKNQVVVENFQTYALRLMGMRSRD